LETQECDGQEPELRVIQQIISGRIIRVVVNKSIYPWRVVTVYKTSQINKYWSKMITNEYQNVTIIPKQIQVYL
jgi:hypothetical protein